MEKSVHIKDQQEIKEEAYEKLLELTRQIDQLKNQVVDAKLQDEFDKLIREMEHTRNDIRKRYNEMAESDEKWDEFEKRTYTDFNSFHDSFRKASTIFNK